MPSTCSSRRALARASQIRATCDRIEVLEHVRELSLRSLLLGDPDQIEALGQPPTVLPEHLPHQPLDAVARDRISNLARDRDTQSRRQDSHLAWRTRRDEHDEVPDVMLSSAPLDLQ